MTSAAASCSHWSRFSASCIRLILALIADCTMSTTEPMMGSAALTNSTAPAAIARSRFALFIRIYLITNAQPLPNFICLRFYECLDLLCCPHIDNLGINGQNRRIKSCSCTIDELLMKFRLQMPFKRGLKCSIVIFQFIASFTYRSLGSTSPLPSRCKTGQVLYAILYKLTAQACIRNRYSGPYRQAD
nr:MAG TPA: hypothetical protein [Caudoviricetes sp.]